MNEPAWMRRWVVLVVGIVAIAPGTPAAAAEVASRPAPSPSFDDNVLTTAYGDGVIYVGGLFTSADDGGRTAERNHAAALDARTGRLLSWAPDTDGPVRAVAVHGDDVYLGGGFDRVDGERRNGLAKLDASSGELDPQFTPDVTGTVTAFAIAHGKLYVGGGFDAIDGQRRSNLAAVDLDSGAVDQRWRPIASDSVRDIETSSSRVYVAGLFSSLNGSSRYRKLAAVSPGSGATDTGFQPDVSSIVRDVTLAPGAVYAAVGGAGGQVVRFRLDGRPAWTATADGDVQSVALLDGVLYTGGHFGSVCRSARTGPRGVCEDGSVRRGRMAAFDTSGRLLSWSPDANSAIGVQTMTADAGLNMLAVGGDFTTLDSGAMNQRHFARFG